MKKSTFIAAAALGGAPIFVMPCAAQNASPPTATSPLMTAASSESEALALLDKAASAYGALDGLAVKYVSYNDERGKVTREAGTLAFEKTGGARFTTSKSGAITILPGGASDPKRALEAAMRRFPTAASLPLAMLVQGKNPLRESPLPGMKSPWQNVRLLPDNGVAVSIAASSALQQSPYDLNFSFYFDPTDNLLRRVDLKARINGENYAALTSFSDIEINPTFAPETFIAPAPAVEPTVAPPSSDTYWDPKLKVGTVPYPLVGADLAKYRGRVVLLDFWATWCGPCVQEVPSMLKSYGKHRPKGFEIIGISLDQDKKSLDHFVKTRKLPWPQLFDGRGWETANARRYDVKAIPFTLLIGKDGKIAAVNPRGAALEPAIVAALKK